MGLGERGTWRQGENGTGLRNGYCNLIRDVIYRINSRCFGTESTNHESTNERFKEWFFSNITGF
jgi:hypothetical protein